MPFDPNEARRLVNAHPDQIILAVVKDGAQAPLLIPKGHKRDTINFFGVEIELSMLHGGTYWIGGDPNVVEQRGAVPNCRSISSDRIVLGERGGVLLPAVEAKRPGKSTALPAPKKAKPVVKERGLF